MRSFVGNTPQAYPAPGHPYPAPAPLAEVSLLKVAKVVSFCVANASLYLAVSRIFLPDLLLPDRARLAVASLLFAASASVLSGMVFIWPSPSNPQRGRPLATTLPLRVFLCASIAILLLFLASWSAGSFGRDATPFLTSSSLSR